MPEIPTSWMAGEPDTYSIESIAALDDSALNALAAELRGWVLRIEEYQIGEPVIESGVLRDYVAADGRTISAAADWSPATDRNQSGELLQWASAPFDGAITKEPILFDVTFGRFDRNKRQPGIDAYQPEFAELGYDRRMEWTGSTEWIVRVPGNTARAETVAFVAAMLAMEGRLK